MKNPFAISFPSCIFQNFAPTKLAFQVGDVINLTLSALPSPDTTKNPPFVCKLSIKMPANALPLHLPHPPLHAPNPAEQKGHWAVAKKGEVNKIIKKNPKKAQSIINVNQFTIPKCRFEKKNHEVISKNRKKHYVLLTPAVTSGDFRVFDPPARQLWVADWSWGKPLLKLSTFWSLQLCDITIWVGWIDSWKSTWATATVVQGN